MPTDYLHIGYEKRKELRQPDKLRSHLALSAELGKHGWHEIIEPEEGNGTAIVHTRNVEIYIVGFIMFDGVVFDPGEDYVYLHVSDYPTFQEFVDAVDRFHTKLVKEWFGEDERLYP